MQYVEILKRSGLRSESCYKSDDEESCYESDDVAMALGSMFFREPVKNYLADFFVKGVPPPPYPLNGKNR